MNSVINMLNTIASCPLIEKQTRSDAVVLAARCIKRVEREFGDLFTMMFGGSK